MPEPERRTAPALNVFLLIPFKVGTICNCPLVEEPHPGTGPVTATAGPPPVICVLVHPRELGRPTICPRVPSSATAVKMMFEPPAKPKPCRVIVCPALAEAPLALAGVPCAAAATMPLSPTDG